MLLSHAWKTSGSYYPSSETRRRKKPRKWGRIGWSERGREGEGKEDAISVKVATIHFFCKVRVPREFLKLPMKWNWLLFFLSLKNGDNYVHVFFLGWYIHTYVHACVCFGSSFLSISPLSLLILFIFSRRENISFHKIKCLASSCISLLERRRISLSVEKKCLF